MKKNLIIFFAQEVGCWVRMVGNIQLKRVQRTIDLTIHQAP